MTLILENLPLFWTALLQTFQLAVVTLLFATLISALVGLMTVTKRRWVRFIAFAYIELLRDIPLIVNVMFVYFGAPLVGISLDPFAAATISFSLWGGANGAEIVRSGFASVSRHQEQSAMALGLKPWEIFWFVLGPQALLPMIPPFTGLFALLIQATSLASIVGATEFFRAAQIVVERTTLTTGYSPAFLIYGFVLLVYFVICASLAAGTKKLERYLTTRQSRRMPSVPTAVQPVRETV